MRFGNGLGFLQSCVDVVGPVLHRLCDVRRLNGLASGKIRDRTRDAEDTVVAAGGEPERVKRLMQQRLPRRVQRAVFVERALPHMGVGVAVGAEAPVLHRSRPVHTRADGGRRRLLK